MKPSETCQRKSGKRPGRTYVHRAWVALFVMCATLSAAVSQEAPEEPTSAGEVSKTETVTETESTGEDTAQDTDVGAPEIAGARVLPPRFRDWFDEVTLLLTAQERAVFLSLDKDYQRDAFIRKFWQARDPYLRTARNELRERWDERVAFARSNFEDLTDARSQVVLLHGPPQRRVEIRCTTTRVPAEIWLYTQSERIDFRVVLIFVKSRGGQGPAQLWIPGRNSVMQAVAMTEGCVNGSLLGDLVEELTGLGADYDLMLARVLAKPRPRSAEWVMTFNANTTDLPRNAELFDATLDTSFLGAHQSRTVLQSTLSVDPGELTLGDLGGYKSFNLQLIGEIVRGDQLFESFRYKFGFPRDEATTSLDDIPMAFQRFLRPGDYTLLVRLEDLNSGKFFRQVRELEVPMLENEFEVPRSDEPQFAALYQEATESWANSDTGLQILPPAGDIHTGFRRFDTLVTGQEIERVRFILDDQTLLTKNRPPFNVEIDLGPFPRLHLLRVEGLDTNGDVVATDEHAVNSGGYRFSVRLVEPREGGRYRASLNVRADVEVPENRSLDRVEVFLAPTQRQGGVSAKERLVATLYQEPFVQPIVLPESEEVAYVRTVAHLTDGNTTEDVVFINNPDQTTDKVEVQYVELFVGANDRSGRPIKDLERADVGVREDGVSQTITRFERVENLPVHVGVLIDNSASMGDALETTRVAALSFFQSILEPKDRAALITFNRFPHVAVKLTNDVAELGGGLAGLTAEGQTALYDSVMFTLYYLSGITGQRAVLLLSDGKDEVSRFDFQETLDYAKRAGVTIYTIGLGIQEGGARRRLIQLAHETGGESYFIRKVDALASIYEQIEEELRSQYLVAYQSTNTDAPTGSRGRGADEFRRIEVKSKRSGVELRAPSGYYP